MKTKIKGILCSISPEFTTRLMFYHNFGKKLDLNNPQDFNEKLQYLKLKTYYNNPVVTQCVDKWRIREYLEDRGYCTLLPKLYRGGITDPEEVRRCWEALPNRFVIKCNHGAGYNILVPDKSKVDVEEVVAKLSRWIQEDYWKLFCEPQYKHVKKCILIEEFLGNEAGDPPVDYKCYCFNGRCELIMACIERASGKAKFFFYDRDWNLQMLTQECYDYPEISVEKPAVLESAISYAEAVSKDFPFVRVDLYVVGTEVYLGEMTFVPCGGLDKDFNFISSDEKFGGKSTDRVLGELLNL